MFKHCTLLHFANYFLKSEKNSFTNCWNFTKILITADADTNLTRCNFKHSRPYKHCISWFKLILANFKGREKSCFYFTIFLEYIHLNSCPRLLLFNFALTCH